MLAFEEQRLLVLLADMITGELGPLMIVFNSLASGWIPIGAARCSLVTEPGAIFHRRLTDDDR